MNNPMSCVGPRVSVAVSAAIKPNRGHQRQYPCPAQVMPQISSEQHLSHNQEQKPDKEQNEVLRHLPCPDHRDASLYSEQPKYTRAGNPKPPPDAATSTPRDQTAQAQHVDQFLRRRHVCAVPGRQLYESPFRIRPCALDVSGQRLILLALCAQHISAGHLKARWVR